MNKTVETYVKSSLRRTWSRSKQRQSALKAAKVSYGHYRCDKCGKTYRRKEIQVDHKVAVGRFVSFDLYIERLFCPTAGLDILCIPCHKAKTKKDIKKMSKKKL